MEMRTAMGQYFLYRSYTITVCQANSATITAYIHTVGGWSKNLEV